jgi:hypothetical protein
MSKIKLRVRFSEKEFSAIADFAKIFMMSVEDYVSASAVLQTARNIKELKEMQAEREEELRNARGAQAPAGEEGDDTGGAQEAPGGAAQEGQ